MHIIRRLTLPLFLLGLVSIFFLSPFFENLKGSGGHLAYAVDYCKQDLSYPRSCDECLGVVDGYIQSSCSKVSIGNGENYDFTSITEGDTAGRLRAYTNICSVRFFICTAGEVQERVKGPIHPRIKSAPITQVCDSCLAGCKDSSDNEKCYNSKCSRDCTTDEMDLWRRSSEGLYFEFLPGGIGCSIADPYKQNDISDVIEEGVKRNVSLKCQTCLKSCGNTTFKKCDTDYCKAELAKCYMENCTVKNNECTKNEVDYIVASAKKYFSPVPNCRVVTLNQLINIIFMTFSVIIGGLAILKIILAGYIYSIAAGNSRLTAEAKSHILYALFGIALVVFANLILVLFGAIPINF